MHCREPNPLNETYPSYGEIVSTQEADIFRKWDFSWALARVFDKEKSIPTWAALNSLCSEQLLYYPYHSWKSYRLVLSLHSVKDCSRH